MMKSMALVSSIVVISSAFTPLQPTTRTSSLRYISTNFEEPHPYHGPMGGRPPMDILDMNISEESILKHYQEWCKKFHRRQDNFRFIVFQRNYLSQFKWNLAAGKQAFTLNEFADCTEEEYQRLMSNASPKEVQSGPSLPPAEESFDVSVVMDEDQGTNMYSHELAPGDCIHTDVVDVEVVMHSPFLAGY